VAAHTSDVAAAPSDSRQRREDARAAAGGEAMSGGTWAQEKAHFGLHPAQFIDDVANVMLDCASLFLSRSLEMNTGASRCARCGAGLPQGAVLCRSVRWTGPGGRGAGEAGRGG